MIKVGITGGIGSGKTYVASFFDKIGIPIYNSDIKAKELIYNNVEIQNKLTKEFGNEVFISGQLNSIFLSRIVFSNTEKLKTLNNIVHPKVSQDFEQWCLKHKNKPYIIKEAAILIESGSYKNLDYIILIKAPQKIRIKRVIKRNNISEKEVLKRMDKQLPDKEKMKYSHFIIENSGTENIEEQVNNIHKQILKENEL